MKRRTANGGNGLVPLLMRAERKKRGAQSKRHKRREPKPRHIIKKVRNINHRHHLSTRYVKPIYDYWVFVPTKTTLSQSAPHSERWPCDFTLTRILPQMQLNSLRNFVKLMRPYFKKVRPIAFWCCASKSSRPYFKKRSAKSPRFSKKLKVVLFLF